MKINKMLTLWHSEDLILGWLKSRMVKWKWMRIYEAVGVLTVDNETNQGLTQMPWLNYKGVFQDVLTEKSSRSLSECQGFSHTFMEG